MANSKIVSRLTGNGTLQFTIRWTAILALAAGCYWRHEVRLNAQETAATVLRKDVQAQVAAIQAETQKQVELNLLKWENLATRLERIEGKIDALLTRQGEK